jgi:hypothetical protein
MQQLSSFRVTGSLWEGPHVPFETSSVICLLVENATVLMLSDRLVAFDARQERRHRLSPRCLSHLVPEVETGDVELKGTPMAGHLNAFREESPGDGLLAGVAPNPIAGTAPDVREAAVRETTVVELALNEGTKKHLVHGWHSGWWRSGDTQPNSPGSRRQGVEPEGQGEGTHSLSPDEELRA